MRVLTYFKAPNKRTGPNKHTCWKKISMKINLFARKPCKNISFCEKTNNNQNNQEISKNGHET